MGDLADLRLSGLWMPAVIRLMRRGALVVGVDGFDELAAEQGGADALGALASLVSQLGGHGAVVAASRRTFFDTDDYLRRGGLVRRRPAAGAGAAARLAQQLQALAPPISNGVEGFVHDQVAKIVASPEFATAWDEANRAAHQQLVNVLSGQQSGAVTAKNGQVSINLGPFVDQVKQRLVANGFSVAANIPTVNTSFTVFESQGVTRAQGAYRLLNTLGTWLPILALVLLAIGVYVAKSHRRALLAAGLGVAGGMLLLGVTLAVVRPLYLNAVPPQVPHDAAATIYDTLLRFLRVSLRAVLVAGLVVAAAAFLTGGSVTAVRTRQGLTHGIGWLRGGAESAGLRTGPVGTWVYAHKKLLRVLVLVAAALALTFWTQPTAGTVLLLALLALLCLAIVEFLGRPPGPTVAGAPAPPASPA